jgi:CheY-like chemotaxis protein
MVDRSSNEHRQSDDDLLLKNLHILLIEDNLVNQKVATSMIRKSGGTIDIASNGVDGLKKLATKQYDLILMDCQMPLMDGFQTTRVIRGRTNNSYCDIPIIAVTAFAFPEDRQRCLDAGMNDFLTKPICRRNLVSVVNRYIG